MRESFSVCGMVLDWRGEDAGRRRLIGWWRGPGWLEGQGVGGRQRHVVELIRESNEI